MICERCDGDGWVEVFGDEGFPVGARECEACGGSGSITPFDDVKVTTLEPFDFPVNGPEDAATAMRLASMLDPDERKLTE